MVLVGLLFLLYIGSSLVDSTKRYRNIVTHSHDTFPRNLRITCE